MLIYLFFFYSFRRDVYTAQQLIMQRVSHPVHAFMNWLSFVMNIR